MALRHALLLLLLGLWPVAASAQVERVWLTHRSDDPSRIVVSWMTKQPGDSVVRFGPTDRYGQEVRIDGHTTLHHVEIPLERRDARYHYSVRTGDQTSPDATFKTYSSDVLRIAVAADWQRTPDLSALLADDPHLLVTAGDHVWNLHERCGAGDRDCIRPFAELIDHYPELFRSTPFMPVLGNHDREIRPRGKEPPAEPVYDIDTTAFRRLFELPGDEWKWRFDIPAFDLRLVALDLNHISDMGTTWQSCHPFDRRSEQFQWYERVMRDPGRRFVVTLYNERNARIRSREEGAWHDMISRGTLAITGYGYFAERAEVDGFAYYNTALSPGDQYPDPHSAFLAAKGSYVLLTITNDPREMTVEIKSLEGEVLDRNAFR